jgi:hypothetical protein
MSVLEIQDTLLNQIFNLHGNGTFVGFSDVLDFLEVFCLHPHRERAFVGSHDKTSYIF